MTELTQLGIGLRKIGQQTGVSTTAIRLVWSHGNWPEIQKDTFFGSEAAAPPATPSTTKNFGLLGVG